MICVTTGMREVAASAERIYLQLIAVRTKTRPE